MDAKNSMRVKMLEELIESIMSGKLDSSEGEENMPVEESEGAMGAEKDPKSAKLEMLAIETDPKKKPLGL